MPAILGGLAGILSSLNADPAVYKNIGQVFRCRAPSNATLAAEFGIPPGYDWTNLQQASAQAETLFTSLGIGLVSGIAVGAILKYCTCFTTTDEDLFTHHDYFTEFFVNVADDYPHKRITEENKTDVDVGDIVVEMPKRVEKKRNGDRQRDKEDNKEGEHKRSSSKREK